MIQQYVTRLPPPANGAVSASHGSSLAVVWLAQGHGGERQRSRLDDSHNVDDGGGDGGSDYDGAGCDGGVVMMVLDTAGCK